MRITLEKGDLVNLLGKALNYELTEEDVDVQPEPFEVHIHNIRLNDLAASAPASGSAPAKAGAPVVPESDDYAADRPLASVEDLLEKNQAMIRENLAPGETYEPPDPDEESYLG